MHNIAAESPWKIVFHIFKLLIEDPKAFLYGLLIAIGLAALLIVFKILGAAVGPESIPVSKPAIQSKMATEEEKKEFKKIGMVLYGVLAVAILIVVMVIVKRVRE